VSATAPPGNGWSSHDRSSTSRESEGAHTHVHDTSVVHNYYVATRGRMRARVLPARLFLITGRSRHRRRRCVSTARAASAWRHRQALTHVCTCTVRHDHLQHQRPSECAFTCMYMCCNTRTTACHILGSHTQFSQRLSHCQCDVVLQRDGTVGRHQAAPSSSRRRSWSSNTLGVRQRAIASGSAKRDPRSESV